jgi:hypothetical protein
MVSSAKRRADHHHAVNLLKHALGQDVRGAAAGDVAETEPV